MVDASIVPIPRYGVKSMGHARAAAAAAMDPIDLITIDPSSRMVLRAVGVETAERSHHRGLP